MSASQTLGSSCNHSIAQIWGYLPHASEQLNKPTVSESKTDDDIRGRDSSSADIDEREHKCRQGESAQSQRSRVGELPLCHWSIRTRLEFTSKGRETRLGRANVGKRSVPEAGSGFGSFMLLLGHLASSSIALDCVVVLFVMFRIGGHYGDAWTGCVGRVRTNGTEMGESSYLSKQA